MELSQQPGCISTEQYEVHCKPSPVAVTLYSHLLFTRDADIWRKVSSVNHRNNNYDNNVNNNNDQEIAIATAVFVKLID